MKTIYKNPEILEVAVDDKISALVNPKMRLENAMFLMDKNQLSRYHALEDGMEFDEAMQKTALSEPELEAFIDKLSELKIAGFERNFEYRRSNIEKNIALWVHVTDFCNLKCDYCYITTKETHFTMKPEVLDQLTYKLAQLKKKYAHLKRVTIKLAGGEVFSKFDVWKDAVARMRQTMRKKGITLYIQCLSNLTILNQEIIDYVKKHRIKISVSLDGIGKYNDLHRVHTDGSGSFEKVIANLKKLQDNEVEFDILTVVSEENLEGLPELVEFLVKNGFGFRLSDILDKDLDTSRFATTLQKCYDIMEKYLGEYDFTNKHLLCDLHFKFPTKHSCGIGTNGAAIYIDGNVYSCQSAFGSGKPTGSLYEEDDLLRIIKRAKSYIIPLAKECEMCPYYLICAGACPIHRVKGKSPQCEAFKATIPRIYQFFAKERLLAQ